MKRLRYDFFFFRFVESGEWRKGEKEVIIITVEIWERTERGVLKHEPLKQSYLSVNLHDDGGEGRRKNFRQKCGVVRLKTM